MLGMCCPCEFWFPVEQGTAVVGGEQPLVRVDDEAVGALDASKEMTNGWRGKSGTTVRPVDVHPDAEAFADIGNTGQVVDDAGVRGAGRRNDREHVTRIDQYGPQSVAGELTLIIFRNDYDFGVQHGGCRLDR